MKRLGITQKQLAANTGLHPSVVNMLINGTRAASLGDVQRMVAALGMPLGELFRLTGPERLSLAGLRDDMGATLTRWASIVEALQRDQAEARGNVVNAGSRMPVIRRLTKAQSMPAKENVDTEVLFDPSMQFFLQINDDSMADAGIQEGDWVHVVKAEDYDEADVVVARVRRTGETLVKYLSPMPDGSFLLTPISGGRGLKAPHFAKDELQIVGKIVGAYRPLDQPRRRDLRVAERKAEYRTGE